MAAVVTSRIGKRGTIVLPAQLRRQFGLEEGSIVIAEARRDGILIRPAKVTPVKPAAPKRRPKVGQRKPRRA
jgi:AbrB family looped-hinge helix DNA binding protein